MEGRCRRRAALRGIEMNAKSTAARSSNNHVVFHFMNEPKSFSSARPQANPISMTEPSMASISIQRTAESCVSEMITLYSLIGRGGTETSNSLRASSQLSA